MASPYDRRRETGIASLAAQFGEEAVEKAISAVARFTVEVPAWQLWQGFGGGGRFEGEGLSGAARTMEEIADDAALIHRLTGATPELSVHVLWFLSRDGVQGDRERAREVRDILAGRGLGMGAINPTFFLAGTGDGSFTSQNPSSRAQAIDQAVFGAMVAAELGNGVLSLWWPDGTNYPGQRALQDKIRLMREGVTAFWARVPQAQRARIRDVLFEYKVFEPGTYSTTVNDWGTARELARLVGEPGGVLIDLGHHHHGTNIEQIAAVLITAGIRGGLHLNTRYAADDDHSVQADYPLALLMYELVRGGVVLNTEPRKNWVIGLDQMARTEERIPSVLKSVDALQRAVGKAVLAHATAFEKPFQPSCNLIGANAAFEAALLHADSGPLLMEANHRRGMHPVPLDAYRESGYQAQVEKARG